SAAASSILLIKKPSGSIYIYINYYNINNIILKIYYLLLLIKKTFNIIYRIKIFIKFNIITIFNRIRIKEGYK
ncbi:hypothetical protein NEUTE1DRAFT_47930, partial [Neurospora tetrasperma FGSC 2508]